MNDNYIHADNGIIYIVENIPGPAEQSGEYEELMNNFNSQLTGHCKCHNICSGIVCSCLGNGQNYVKYFKDDNSKYRLNYGKINYEQRKEKKETYPILECNSLCKCSKECPNRLVQKGPIDGLIIKICEIKSKGFGLFTKNFIPQGAFICEYAGEIITQSEALKRHQNNRLQGKMNYIFCLNEYSNSRTVQTFIDPSIFGNIGRYINHSCEPNSIIIPVRVDSPMPKLAIFSCLDIPLNTEITFDYGTYNSQNSDLELENAEANRKKCLCMSKKCSGLMPFDIY